MPLPEATHPIELQRLFDGLPKMSMRGRVFRNAELTPEVLLASACLPTLFQAIEIDGEPYRDGGYSGNPTMTPLVPECA